jgi:hypothetical protein
MDIFVEEDVSTEDEFLIVRCACVDLDSVPSEAASVTMGFHMTESLKWRQNTVHFPFCCGLRICWRSKNLGQQIDSSLRLTNYMLYEIIHPKLLLANELYRIPLTIDSIKQNKYLSRQRLQ